MQVIRNEKLIREIENKYGDEIYCFLKKSLGILHDFEWTVDNIFFFDEFEDKFVGYLDVGINKIDSYEDEKSHYISYKLYVSGNYNKNGISLFFESIEENVYLKTGKPWLDENFVAHYKKAAYDFLASEIRKKYLKNMKPIEIINEIELASELGLTIHHRRLSEDGSIFSALCIEETKVRVYEARQVFEETFPEKSIIVDDMAINLFGGDKSEKFNIIHECVHYIMHQKFYYCRVSSGDIKGFFCHTDGSLNNFAQKMYSDIEKQANGITASLLLPKGEIMGHFSNFKNLDSDLSECDKIKFSIIECSKLFNVSEITFLIRLKELGASNLVGMYEFIDGKFVKPYIFNGLKNDNITFSISNFDLVILYAKDGIFRSKIDSGNYLYIDSHIVINDIKHYYKDSNNKLQLTEYARNNMEKCCLYFEVNYSSSNNVYSNFDYMLHKERRKNSKVDIKFPYSQNDLIPDVSLYDEMKYEADHIGNDLKEFIKWMCDRRNITLEKLAELSNVSYDLIKRLDGSTIRPINFVKICVGLKLPPPISFRLMNNTTKFNGINTELMFACNVILSTMYNHNIYEVEDFLRNLNLR